MVIPQMLTWALAGGKATGVWSDNRDRHSRENGNPVITRGSADTTHVAADAALAGFPPARE